MIVLLIASRENTKKIFSALRAKTVMQVVMQPWESKLELFVSKGILPDSKEIRGTGVMRIFLLLLLFCVPVGALTTDVEVFTASELQSFRASKTTGLLTS